MPRFLFLVSGLTVVSALAVAAAATTAAGTTPTFTAAQATKGAATYKAQCAACHGSKLDNGGAPKLSGSAFLKKWGGNTLDDFHYIMSTTMPQTHPGGLKPEEYLNIEAYVLQQNGFKAGDTALKLADLKSETFEK